MVAASAALTYLSSLHNQFTYDDVVIVAENKRLAEWHNLRRMWLTDWWYAPPEDSEERHRDRLYRPLTMQTLGLNYAVGRLRPFGYHLFNVAAHVVVSVLVCLLTQALLADALMALLSGLLFAVHPIHTEAVANVVGRAEVLSALFVVLGLLCVCRDLAARTAASRIGWRTGLWLSFLLGLFSKEQGICLVLLAPLCEWWVRRRDGQRMGAKEWTRSLAVRYLPLVPLFALYVVMRWFALEGHLVRDATPAALDNPLSAATVFEQIFTPPAILATYLRLMLWPDKLCSDYSFEALPLAGAPWKPLTALGIAAAVGAAVWAARSLRRDGVGFFVVLAFALSYALISNAVLMIGTICGERLFYLPSVFVCWAMVYGARWGVRRLETALGADSVALRAMPWITAGLLAAFALRSTVRNLDWYDGPRLFTHDIEVSPNSARLQLFVARSLLHAGRRDEAEAHVRRSIEIYPYLANSHRLLGWLYAQVGDWARAEPEYQLALQLRWEYREAQREYERYRRFFEHKEAQALAPRIEELEGRIAAQPANRALLKELGALQFQAGEYRAAIKTWRRVLALDPDDLDARFELATLLGIDEQFDEATEQFQTIVARNPADWRAHANLCRFLIGRDADAALAHARQAIRLNPDSFEAHMNLATALLAVGKKTEGLKELRLVRAGLPENHPMRQLVEHRIRELR